MDVQPAQDYPAAPIAASVTDAAAAAVRRRFFDPLRRPRTRKAGVELELPIASFKQGRPVDFAVVHGLVEAFAARFGYGGFSRDDEGHVYSATEPVSGDALSFDCSYNTLEFSFAPEEDLNVVNARFRAYYAFAQEFLAPHALTLNGLGINPRWRVNRAVPIPSSRYRMLLQYLESAPDYAVARIVPFHAFPHFGLFSCASQVQLDADEATAVKATNAFTLFEPFKAMILANSPFGTGFEWLCGRDYLWRNSLHGLNPHNCGLYNLAFRSLDEIANYLLTTSIYCAERDGVYVHFAPMAFTDYLACPLVTGWVEEAAGARVFTLRPEPEDVRFLRPFKFADLTHRGTIEFRSVCEQPVSEVMASAALHAGLYENLDAFAELVQTDDTLYGHGYNVSELRELFCRRNWPGFIDRAAVSRQLLRILDLAADGLVRRGANEAHFLSPLYARAETLRSPARQFVEAIESGTPVETLMRRFAGLA